MIRERKDTEYLKSKREERGQKLLKEALIVFTDSQGGFVKLIQRPNTLGVIELSNIAYFGKIDITNGMVHKCTCRSYYHGNVEEFLATHAENFECKHILAAYFAWNSARPRSNKILDNAKPSKLTVFA